MTESNVFAHVYKSLLTLILNINYPSTSDPVFQYVAQDFSQIDMESGPTIYYPAVLINFETATYTDHSTNIQNAGVIVTFRIVDNSPYVGSNLESPPHIFQSLRYFDYEAWLHLALQRWNDQYFSPFTRINAFTEKRNDSLRVRQVRYSFSFCDDSSLDLITTPKPEIPEILPEIDDIA